jgi:hypothetical protein
MNKYSNIVSRYDDMLYDSRPTKFDEFINDKYNKVHLELYNDALEKYYDHVLSTLFGNEFIYEFFNLMTNNSDSFDTFYNAYLSLPNTHILKKTLNELSLLKYDFIKVLFEQTNKALNNILLKIKLIILGDENAENIGPKGTLKNINDFRVIYSIDNVYLGPEEDEQDINHEFLTYTFESINNRIEVIEEKMFMSEMDIDSYVFILEAADTGTRIGFNIDGKWLLILRQEEKEAAQNDEELYGKIIEIITYIEKTNEKLINTYFKKQSLINYKNTHKIIEIKNDEYWQPSSIIDISTIRPYKKTIINLEKFWNMSQSYNDIDVYTIMNTSEKLNDCELIGIDYIKGIAKIRSRINDLEYDVPFKYLNEDIDVSDELTLKDTFGFKYNN